MPRPPIKPPGRGRDRSADACNRPRATAELSNGVAADRGFANGVVF